MPKKEKADKQISARLCTVMIHKRSYALLLEAYGASTSFQSKVYRNMCPALFVRALRRTSLMGERP